MESPELERQDSADINRQRTEHLHRYMQHYSMLPWNWMYPYSMWGGLPPSYLTEPSSSGNKTYNLNTESAFQAGFLHMPYPSMAAMWGQKAAEAASSGVSKFTIDEILGRGEKPADLSTGTGRRDTEDDDDDSSDRVSASSSPASPESSSLDDYSWLQCTRYKPPKLPSKYIYVMYTI